MTEKSAAREACRPSLPTIPTPVDGDKVGAEMEGSSEAECRQIIKHSPTSAACIILTSFPPSPIQHTRFPVYERIKRAMSACRCDASVDIFDIAK